MPAPAKLSQTFGALGKEEAVYGVAETLAAAQDGLQAQFENRDFPRPQLAYDFDGDLGPSVGNLGTVLHAAKAGRSVTYEFPTRAKGAGVAYSASIFPSIHRLLKAAGFTATGSFGAGVEKWDYAPTAPGTGYTSLTKEIYVGGEKYPLVGVLYDWGFDWPNGGPPMHRFTANGFLSADVSDAAVPSITYPLATIQPPLANGVSLVMGSFSTNAVAYSGGFTLGREILPRVARTASGGHLGFVPRGRQPEARVVIEATALTGSPFHSTAAFNHWKMEEGATSVAFSVQFGTVQYLRWKLAFAQAQVIGVAPQVVNGVACVELTFRAHTSTPIAGDDILVTFD